MYCPRLGMLFTSLRFVRISPCQDRFVLKVYPVFFPARLVLLIHQNLSTLQGFVLFGNMI